MNLKTRFEFQIAKKVKPGWASKWPEVEAGRRTKGAAAVSLSEYDFSDVPEDELEACVHYEYARESVKIVKFVEEMREQLLDGFPKGNGDLGKTFKLPLKCTKFTKTHESMYDGWILMALASRPGFPRVGWQDLTSDDRQILKAFPDQAVEMHNQDLVRQHPVFIAELVQDNCGLAVQTLASWESDKMPALYRKVPEDIRRPSLLTGFMMVNMLHSPDEIVARFKKWLLKRHPRANEHVPEKRGRKSPRDRLNALGAMRLRFYCRTLNEAQKLAGPLRNKGGMSYSDRTAWNRACARAVEYYREVLDLPENDLPIHFSNGWQK